MDHPRHDSPSARGRISFELLVDLGPRVGADHLDAVTRQLQDELARSGLGIARLPERPVPHGAKGSGLTVVGALLVSATPVTIPGLVDLLHQWVVRNNRRSLTVRGRRGNETVEVVLQAQRGSSGRLARTLETLAADNEMTAETDGRRARSRSLRP